MVRKEKQHEYSQRWYARLKADPFLYARYRENQRIYHKEWRAEKKLRVVQTGEWRIRKWVQVLIAPLPHGEES